ncbi:DUF1294 domain-containing protein [Agarivorans sp.]|uniref:DUF1294 domain-containing protein n=1 Tax=Agarivorans sp. TaxID=1872412 RepID=UPI003D063EF2
MAKNLAGRSAGRSGLLAAAFFAVLGGLVTADYLPLWVLVLYLVMSVLTFGFYVLDKSAARAGRWRVAEFKLHYLALFGGWPGAMFAQSLLRHKTQKRSFRLGFYLTLAFNLALLGYLLSPGGRAYAQAFEQVFTGLF